MDESKHDTVKKLLRWERTLQKQLELTPGNGKTKDTLLRVQNLKERALWLYFKGKEKIE